MFVKLSLQDAMRLLSGSGSPENTFRPIPMTGNLYEINEAGTILRLRKTKQPRKFRLDERMSVEGYYYARIFKPGAVRTGKYRPRFDLYIHCAVADAFLGPLPPDMEVHHKDHNSLNNSASNLLVLTPEEHMKIHGKTKATTRRRRKMTKAETISETVTDMFKPRRNPERINWDRCRDLAGEKSILWNCAGCTGRPSYWGSDEKTVWQHCQRCGHEKITSLDTLLQDLTALKNDRCPKCYARDKHPQSLVWKLERCTKCVRWPFKRELDGDKPQFSPELQDWKCRREYVWERDHYTCQYCGKVTNSPHCDHVVPLFHGGDDSLENLVTACPHCNISKGDRTPEEWRASKDRRGEGKKCA